MMTQTGAGAVPAVVVHKFELAGLGAAPYRFSGHAELKYQACPGAPVQPGGSCDFCGTAIIDAYYFVSKDGKRFKVGSDCVFKAGDRGMVNLVKKAANKIKLKAAHARADAKIAAALATLEDPAVVAALEAQPHPRGWEGRTLMDWVDWMLKNAGRKGRVEVSKVVAKYAAPAA